MGIVACPECKGKVSDRAPTCPHCGYPLLPPQVFQPWLVTVAILVALAAAAAVFGIRHSEYGVVEQLRAEQDAEGTHDEHTRQRFYRLYQEHPGSAVYIYLWARCVEDPREQLALAEKGIAADARFAWNYNMAARALARMNRVSEAYDLAQKGEALDPGNLELVKKKAALQVIVSRKLEGSKLTPGSAAVYEGLFHSYVRGDHPEIVVCANPYADMCVRVVAPRDEPFPPNLKEHQLVKVTGTVGGGREPVIHADHVTVG